MRFMNRILHVDRRRRAVLVLRGEGLLYAAHANRQLGDGRSRGAALHLDADAPRQEARIALDVLDHGMELRRAVRHDRRTGDAFHE
jgi:hypothetical protein